MSKKYKLVPVKPTQEMIDAALKSDHAEISPRRIVEQDYKAMLAAAPECGCCGRADRCDDDCDAAPQPVEQQPAPDVTALVEALELMVSTHDEGGWPTAAITIARAALAAHHIKDNGNG